MSTTSYANSGAGAVAKKRISPWLIVFGILVLFGIYAGGTYNGLVRSDQDVQSQWAQVQNVYQRRLDLVPNLVETVKGAAAFEKSTFTAVAEARAKAGTALANAGSNPGSNPAALQQVDQTQNGLSSALARLLVVVERYPELKATENFRDLQAQLEGTENRIAVERMRFNESARTFNAKRNSFPTNLVAGMFGTRFNEKSYFQAEAGAQSAPKVKF